MKQMKKKLLQRKGSILTEAAIFLPIFLIAVATLLFLLKTCWIDVLTVSTVEDRLRKDSVAETNLSLFLAGTQLEENGLKSSAFQISETTFSGCTDMDGLKRISFVYDTEISLPVQIMERIYVKNVLAFRKWEGREITGTPMDFSEMETSESGTLVTVFPRAGEKYHGENCRYANSYAVRKTLNASIRSQYHRCPLCTSGNEASGCEVWVFPSGRSYHLVSCPSVTKYIIQMDKSDAIEKGYTACSVCGGNS